MNPEPLFFADGRLRSIWRFFVSIVLLFVAYVAAGVVVGAIFRSLHFRPPAMVAFFFVTLAVLPAILAAFKLLTAVFDRRPLGSVGLAFHPRWGRELLHGVAVGVVMLGVAVALEWAGGFVQFSHPSQNVMQAGAFMLVLFAVAAINEEATFRGYPFQRLVESITPVGAIAVSAALFGLLHLGNPHHTWISTINTMLVGIPFAIAYLRTRSLWMPVGMHFIWNFLMGFVLGLPVSGLTIPSTVLVAVVHGPAWLTGAEYGPEGGVLATAAIIMATVYLSFSKSIYTTEEMQALVDNRVTPAGPEQPISLWAENSAEDQERD
jgi:uncharacterized protein